MSNNNLIGIIAGSGLLPDIVISSCLKNNFNPFVVYVDRQPSITNVPYLNINIASVGKTIKWLKSNNIEQILFVGKINRPKWSALRPDAGGIKLLTKLTKSFIQGDNALLSLVLSFFEENGFKILQISDIAPQLIVQEEVISSKKPDQSYLADIEFATRLLSNLSPFDVGQGLIIQNKVILGIEAIEGTDELIKRCKNLKTDNSQGAILVKRKKDNQDVRIDLPTIGPQTIDNAYQSGLYGIALQAGFTVIIDRQTVKNKLDEYGMFLIGTK